MYKGLFKAIIHPKAANLLKKKTKPNNNKKNNQKLSKCYIIWPKWKESFKIRYPVN